MSATTVVACCCEDVRWYALKCPDLMPPCCGFNLCEGAPPRIDLCVSYMQSIGIPANPDPGICYVIAYECCAYVLTDTDTPPCPNPGSPYPTNVGTLAFTFTKGAQPCCRPLPQQSTAEPPGTMADVIIPACGGPVISNPDPVEFPCREVIADCYELCDQYGIVKGKELAITSNLSVCVNIPGVPVTTRCNHGPSDEVYSLAKPVEAKIGQCQPCEFLNGNPVPDPGGGFDCVPEPFACPNQITQVWEVEAQCPDCWPFVALDCCGGTNPCDSDPNACAGTLDIRETYETYTCYSVNDCDVTGTEFQVEDLIRLEIDECIPISEGVDPTIQAQLEAWVQTNFVTFNQSTYDTCWGFIATFELFVCGLQVTIVSGTAREIARRINLRIGTLVQATALNKWQDYFWFGTRQSCEICDWQYPETRPTFAEGDVLELGPITYDYATGRISIILRGVSKKKFVCVSQSIDSYRYNCLQEPSQPFSQATVICAISGTELPYAVQCLSLPEFASGERYEFVEIEQEERLTTICTDVNTYVQVTECPARAGWPLDDVIVTPPVGPPYVSVYGWHTLCASMPDPAYGCRCYPLIYTPAPCCPDDYPDCEVWEATHPLPDPCVLNCFQSASVYCVTTATDLAVTYCGTP